jgi:hypothetical protein
MRGPYLIPSPLPVLLGRFLEKQMSKWKKTYDEREKLLADAKGEYVGHADILRPATVSLNRSNAHVDDDDEDGKREGLSSSMWVSAVQAYVCTHICAYVRVRVCVCVYVFKLTLVGSVYMYVLCIVL